VQCHMDHGAGYNAVYETLMKLVIMGKEHKLSVGLDNVPRITKIKERSFAYKDAWEDDKVFIYSCRYVDDSNFGDPRHSLCKPQCTTTPVRKLHRYYGTLSHFPRPFIVVLRPCDSP